MELKHIKGIGPAKQDKLKEAGVDSVEALARADVAKVAKATGISEATIKEFKEKAVAQALLTDIKGIGPATIQSLAESGITSAKELYEASSERLAKELKVAQEKVQGWQKQAQDLAAHVAEGAKTSEGRKQLAVEAKDVTVKTAKATQEKLVDLYHVARKEGESAIQKAQALREDAPAKLKDAREKAEKALADAKARVETMQEKIPAAKDIQAKAEKAVQDAQAKVADLKQKTEGFVKTEVEKVKAANEGFFGKLKARFAKSD